MWQGRLCVAVAVAVCTALVPASIGTAAGPAHAAKKKCKNGYRLVTVKKHGKTRHVCKKKRHAAPAGPSVAEVEAIVRGQEQAGAPAYLQPEDVEVIFDRPTKILGRIKYDADGDPNNGSGPINAWPARVYGRAITHRDSTPEDDTHYLGCLAHQNRAWPYDSIYYFFKSEAGGWEFRSGDPGTVGC